MSRIEVHHAISGAEIGGFRRRAKRFPGFKKPGKDPTFIRLRKLLDTYDSLKLVDIGAHRLSGSWGDLPVDEEALLDRFTLESTVTIITRYYRRASPRVAEVSIRCGAEFSIDFSNNIRQKLLEAIVQLDRFRGKVRVQGYLIASEEGAEGWST